MVKPDSKRLWGCDGAWESFFGGVPIGNSWSAEFLDCKGLCCSSCLDWKCKARCRGKSLKKCPARKPFTDLIFEYGVFQSGNRKDN